VQKYLKEGSSEHRNDFSHSTKREDVYLAQQLVTTQRLFNGVYHLVKIVLTSYYNNNNNNNHHHHNNNCDDDNNENDNSTYCKKSYFVNKKS